MHDEGDSDVYCGRSCELNFKVVQKGLGRATAYQKSFSMNGMRWAVVLNTQHVVTLRGNHVSDTPAWVPNIPFISWNDMNMQVENRLSGGPPNIDADVVGVRRMMCFDRGLGALDSTD